MLYTVSLRIDNSRQGRFSSERAYLKFLGTFLIAPQMIIQ